MWSTPQILIVIGLIIEAFSFYLTIMKLFQSYGQYKTKNIDFKGMSGKQRYEADRKRAIVYALFFTLGILLQIIAVVLH